MRLPTPAWVDAAGLPLSRAVRSTRLRFASAPLWITVAAVVAAGVGLGAWNARAGVAPLYSQSAPVVVLSELLLEPVLVNAPLPIPPRAPLEKARIGEPIDVQITVYCLKGITRAGNPVRDGIVAADPRIFPLGSTIELTVRGKSLGRFLVDDTGGVVKGGIIDIWKASCLDAIKFGRKYGAATLVSLPRPRSRAR